MQPTSWLSQKTKFVPKKLKKLQPKLTCTQKNNLYPKNKCVPNTIFSCQKLNFDPKKKKLPEKPASITSGTMSSPKTFFDSRFLRFALWQKRQAPSCVTRRLQARSRAARHLDHEDGRRSARPLPRQGHRPARPAGRHRRGVARRRRRLRRRRRRAGDRAVRRLRRDSAREVRRSGTRDVYMYWTTVSSISRCYNMFWDQSRRHIYFRLPEKRKWPMLRSSTNASIYRVTKHAASFAQSFKYRFSFPSMYRRLKSTRLIQCYERKQIQALKSPI